MRRWLLADRAMRCGFAWCRIPSGTPCQLIDGVGPTRVRCPEHAEGEPDMDAIVAEAEARAVRDEQTNAWSPVRRLVAAQRRLFDPKARAANSHD